MMRHVRENRQRGVLLISSLLVISLFLVYSSTLALRTTTQQRVADRLHDRLQAMDAAQGATEQLREELYLPINNKVGTTGDASGALAWLDRVGTPAGATNPAFTYTSKAAALQINLPATTLPTGATTQPGLAWVSSVVREVPGNPLSARIVTVNAEATVGSVTKRIQATYRIALGMSDIFRYAYFLNNYGWLEANGSNRIAIHGEIRANGDLDIISDSVVSGETPKILVNGDLYASINSDLVNPRTRRQADGLIGGNPTQASGWNPYRLSKPGQARPARRVTESSQPAIGGTPKILPTGKGWNSDTPEQSQYTRQAIQEMPYLGDLTLYKTLATDYRNPGPDGVYGNRDDVVGASLTYNQPGPDGRYSTRDDIRITMNQAQLNGGPNGSTGDADDRQPIVLIGTRANPIVVDGPVVITGDVILRGVIKGRGTIYTNRNLHIVGSTTYQQPPFWPSMERNNTTGQLRQTGVGGGLASNLGTVCRDGTYVAPGGAIPGGC